MSLMPSDIEKIPASYRVFALADMSYGVEVTIPDTFPTTVRPFASEADAERWIERHKEKSRQQPAKKPFRARNA